jgi:hypothetical protein
MAAPALEGVIIGKWEQCSAAFGQRFSALSHSPVGAPMAAVGRGGYVGAPRSRIEADV